MSTGTTEDSFPIAGYLSSIRLDAWGDSAATVERILQRAADIINNMLDLEASLDGECVIERNVGEPRGGPTAFTGRLKLHPNVAHDAGQHARLAELPEGSVLWTMTEGLHPGPQTG